MLEIEEGSIFPAQVLKTGTKDLEIWQSFQITSFNGTVKPTIYVTPPIEDLKELDYVRLNKFIRSKVCSHFVRGTGWVGTYSYFFECTKVGDADGKVKKYVYSGKKNPEDFNIPDF